MSMLRKALLALAAVVACTTTPASSTALSTTTTTATPPAVEPTKVYYFLDGGDRAGRPGPFLVPVYREVEADDVVARTMVALLAGPTADEAASEPAINSAIPAGTSFLGVEISDGLATVDLSPTFDDGGGSFSMFGRLAEVIFTLTQFPEIDSVSFLLNGEPVEVFSNEGIGLDHPQARDDYIDLMPMLFVDEPAYGAPVGNPMRVAGVAAAFEATFDYTIVDGDDLIIAEGFLMTDNGVGWGNFDTELAYEVDSPQRGALIVSDTSAESGKLQNVREYPVMLVP